MDKEKALTLLGEGAKRFGLSNRKLCGVTHRLNHGSQASGEASVPRKLNFMRTIYINCDWTGGIGQHRLVTRTADGLADLRKACAEALHATPRSEWCYNKNAEQIIEEMIRAALTPKHQDSEMYIYRLVPTDIEVVLRVGTAHRLELERTDKEPGYRVVGR